MRYGNLSHLKRDATAMAHNLRAECYEVLLRSRDNFDDYVRCWRPAATTASGRGAGYRGIAAYEPQSLRLSYSLMSAMAKLPPHGASLARFLGRAEIPPIPKSRSPVTGRCASTCPRSGGSISSHTRPSRNFLIVCLAAHDGNFVGGLQETSDCYSHPGKAGGTLTTF